MERIREALEKAEKDRQQAIQGNGQPVSDANVAPLPTAESGDEGLRPVDATRVAPVEKPAAAPAGSTDVRVVPVSEETMIENRLVAGIPDSPYRDSYRMLRSRVLDQMEQRDWRKIGVVSPTAGAGKTLTTVNLAISMAADLRYKVLLIDADLRRPTVHKYFGIELERGISDYLTDGGDWKELLFNPGIDRLTVLPGCNPVIDSAELLLSPRGQELAQEIMTDYADYLVIVDMPPVLEVDDAIAYGKNMDCLLMVAENGSTRSNDLQAALGMLSERNILGTVLNKAQGKPRARY